MNAFLCRRAPAAAAVLAFLVAGSAYGEVVPPWEVPDEPWHAAYIEALAAGRLPTAEETYEWHQPPLYYAFVATGFRIIGRETLERSEDNLYFPFDAAAYRHEAGEPAVGPLRLMRRFTSLLAPLTIVLTWATAMAVGGARARRTAAIAALVVALLPQYVFITNGLSNDAAASAAGAAIAYGCVCWVRGGRRKARGRVVLACGAAIGVATKLNVLALLPMVVIGAYFVGRDSRRGPRRAAGDFLVIAVPSILMAGGFLLTLPEVWQALRLNAVERALRPVAIDVDASYMLGQLGRTLSSAIGRFGWLQIDLPNWAYRFAAISFSIAMAGVAALLWRSFTALRHADRSSLIRTKDDSRSTNESAGRGRWPSAASLVILSTGCASSIAAVMRNLLVDPQPQGRLLFPALSAGAVLFAIGWIYFAPAVGISSYMSRRSWKRTSARAAESTAPQVRSTDQIPIPDRALTLNSISYGTQPRAQTQAWTSTRIWTWACLPIAALVAMNFVALVHSMPTAFERSKSEPPAGQRIVRLLPPTWVLAARLEGPGRSVVQTLSIPTAGLARISVPLENIERRGALTLTLRHPASGASSSAIHHLELPAYERWAWIDVEAPPDLPQSESEAVELEIGFDDNGAVALWGSLDDFYPDGRLSGEAVDEDARRDLVMLLHYRTSP